MVEYKAGDKVKVVELPEFMQCEFRNKKGMMDHWAGKIVTIKAVFYRHGDRPEYLIYEDEGEFKKGNWINECEYNQWVWDNDMFEGLYNQRAECNSSDLLEFLL